MCSPGLDPSARKKVNDELFGEKISYLLNSIKICEDLVKTLDL